MTFGGFMYRWRWMVLSAWVAGGAAMVLFVPKVDPTANEAESFLPEETKSRQAEIEFRKHFPASSGLSEAVAVFERPEGKLTSQDLQAIDAVAARVRVMPSDPVKAKELEGIVVRSPGWLKDRLRIAPESNPLISRDGQAALVTVSSPANFITTRACHAADHLTACIHLDFCRRMQKAVLTGWFNPMVFWDEIRAISGLHAAVTGSAGYGHDYLLAAQRSHDKTLLITIAAVVLILLVV
ncbi:MAG: MMPL family transporter, partial [Planctomycetota bacterium]